MNINFKKLSGTAITPLKAHATDACFDLFANEDVVLKYGETRVVPTGIAMELPDGYYADVRPRSGLTSKSALRVHLGTIDSNYRGDIGIICENASKPYLTKEYHHALECMLYKLKGEEIVIKRGDKIAQILVQKLPEIELVETTKLSDSERGLNGFGSTDNKEGK